MVVLYQEATILYVATLPTLSLSLSLPVSTVYPQGGGAEAAAAASLPPPPPAEAAASGLNGGHNQASQPIERGYHQPPPF